MESGWIKLKRDPAFFTDMWKRHRPTMWLLFYIAQNAKRETTMWIKPGQCEIRGHEEAGLSNQEYKTAKKNLKNIGFAKFTKRNNVTLATLLEPKLYDINIIHNEGNQRSNQQTDLNINNDELSLTIS
ncbi:hypothetical protein OAM01_02725, partial [bacterium]|nr:hypothetical protein [bacterium]